MWEIQTGIPHSGDDFRTHTERSIDGAPDYVVLDELGRGSTGTVYRALHLRTEVEVALKRLHRLDPDELYYLKREFRLVCEVHHPSLIHVYELVADERDCFLTMELVDGPHLVEWVRRTCPDGYVDDALVRRTCQALAQLADALAVLHSAGRVHRDIKPSNVRVSENGRAVLLDFGLMAVVRGRRRSLREVAGTAPYMAPEMIWTGEASSAVDIYALGLMIHECLTGQRVFDAHNLIRLDRLKRDGAPQLPREVPDWLSELIARMTSPDARARPSAAEIRKALYAGRHTRRNEILHPRFLVGRQQVMETLMEVSLGHRLRNGTLVEISGPSGIGKTHLVSTFCDHLEGDPSAFVLRGRCLPVATVPLPGIDGIVDAISQELSQLRDEDVASCAPRNAGDLLQAFPVFARVKAFASVSGVVASDPRERRRRAFEALRSILRSMTRLGSVVVWLDDVQWSDRDSLRFWSDTLSQQVPLLLIATCRETDSKLIVDSVSRGEVPVVRIPLEPLTKDETRLLVEQSSDEHHSEEATTWIAQQSGGNPFLALQFARHWASASNRTHVPGKEVLACMLQERLATDDGEAYRLLELSCVSMTPVSLEVLSKAGDLTAPGAAIQALLRAGHLIERVALSPDATIVPYHDRIREAIVNRLPEGVRRKHHRRLAEELSRTRSADPSAVFWHWHESGHPSRARTYAIKAGDRFMEALAFDQACRMYNLALRSGARGEDTWQVHEKLGAAHEAAGEGHLAGESYQSAAQCLATQRANERQMRHLLRRSADAFLRSGYLAQGYDNLSKVLPPTGAQMPGSNRGLMLFTMRKRAETWLKNLVSRKHTPLTDNSREELDALLAATVGLVWADNAASTFYQAQYVARALRTDDAIHRARALATESCYLAAPGVRVLRRRGHALADNSLRVAAEIGDPNLLAFVHTTSASTAFLSGQWQKAVSLCEGALDLIENHCVGAGWELSSAYLFSSWSLSMMGELAAIESLRPKVMEHARMRGDLLASTCVRVGFPNLTWLAKARPDIARSMAKNAREEWSSFAYSPLDFFGMIGEVQADLFEGDVTLARSRFESESPRVRSSLLVHNQVIRALWNYFDGATALAASAGVAEVDELCRVAKAASRRLRREKMPWCSALADALDAGRAWKAEEPDQCFDLLRRARSAFSSVDMSLFSAAADYHLQRLAGVGGSCFSPEVAAPTPLAQCLLPLAYAEV